MANCNIYILGWGQCVQVSLCPLLVPRNVIIEPLNVSKNKGTIEFDNNTVRCDVGTTLCENGTINVRKERERDRPCDGLRF